MGAHRQKWGVTGNSRQQVTPSSPSIFFNPRLQLISSPSMNSVMFVLCLPFRDGLWLPMIRRCLAPRLMHTHSIFTQVTGQEILMRPRMVFLKNCWEKQDPIAPGCNMQAGFDIFVAQTHTNSEPAVGSSIIYHTPHINLHVCDARSAGGPTFSRWASSQYEICAWINGSRVLPFVEDIYPTDRYCSSPWSWTFWVGSAIFNYETQFWETHFP